MAGGRKRANPRAALTGGSFGGGQLDRVYWTPCGRSFVQATWQEMVGHELSEERARKFRTDDYAMNLADLDADDVQAAAAVALASNADGNLLLREWWEAVQPLARARIAREMSANVEERRLRKRDAERRRRARGL
jgi:hypothetical protein